MVFNVAPAVLFVILIVLGIWLSIVSVTLFKSIANYNRLTNGISDKTLSQVLENFIAQGELTRREHQHVQSEIKKLRNEQIKFVQKIGLVRFNPFADTGGDQSFALALLDGRDSGIVITSLYGRAGMRWYVKTVKEGKGQEFALSKEETTAIKKVIAI